MKKAKTPPQRPSPYQKYRWCSLRVLWLALGTYLLMILLSFDPQDPSFNMVSDFADIVNLGGYVGAILARFLLSLFGVVAFAIPLFLLQQNAYLLFAQSKRLNDHLGLYKYLALTLTLVCTSILVATHFNNDNLAYPDGSGGIIGTSLALPLSHAIGLSGMNILLLAIVFLGISYIFHSK